MRRLIKDERLDYITLCHVASKHYRTVIIFNYLASSLIDSAHEVKLEYHVIQSMISLAMRFCLFVCLLLTVDETAVVMVTFNLSIKPSILSPSPRKNSVINFSKVVQNCS